MQKFTNSLLALSLIVLLSGCEEKKESQNTPEPPKPVASATSVQSAGAIKVTENVVKKESANPLVGYNIDGERVVRIAPDGEETQLTKQIGAIATVKNNYEKLNAKILSQRLSKNFILKCSACHDDYANGVIGPSLLEKSEEEIFKMITAYRSGEKKNILMKDLVKKMEDGEIRELAKEISEFNKEIREKK